MGGEIFAADVEGIEGVGGVGAVFAEGFFGFGRFLAGLVCGGAVATGGPATADGRGG